MKIDIDPDVVDAVVMSSLLEMYDDIDAYIINRKGGDVSLPMYSSDKKEDLKKCKELRKALKRVHNYYAVPDKRL